MKKQGRKEWEGNENCYAKANEQVSLAPILKEACWGCGPFTIDSIVKPGCFK